MTKGNRISGTSKADSGRAGRGADAFSPKEWKEWQSVLRRMDEIVEADKRKQQAGAGKEMMRTNVIELPTGGVKI
jgi:hypothetical protein